MRAPITEPLVDQKFCNLRKEELKNSFHRQAITHPNRLFRPPTGVENLDSGVGLYAPDAVG